jgi:hypothetical protein
MGVVVALVMSVASRSLSDTVLSRQERESSAAFSVAETGVENAMNALRNQDLQTVSGPLSDLSGLVTGNYNATLTTYSLFVKEGETSHLDVSTFSPSITIFWTFKGDNSEDLTCGTEGSGGSAAAIEITAIQESTNTVQRSYFNPSSCNISNNFLSSSDGGSRYRSTVTYTVPTSPNATVVRIKPLYAGATIAVTGTQGQMYLIQSAATGGDAQKEIEVKRGLNAPPSIFDFAVFAAQTIVK